MTHCRTRAFQRSLEEHGLILDRRPLEILQVNLGKLCNQACHHCHVEAGPKRTEIMTLATMERLLALLEATPSIHTVDITGGAPELNPHFRTFVTRIRALGRNVMDRCNLTVLFEPGQQDTAAFLAEHQVQVVASLPCYAKKNVENQRGRGVFDKSILALQNLNALGYGRERSGLELSLVYNPSGAFLPPPQAKLQQDYRRELKTLFDIEFNQLFTITNMPIKRFGDYLKRHHQWDDYMELLIDHFNPAAVEGVMCRNLISIGWDGGLYDCDFNQMLEMPVAFQPSTIFDIPSFAVLAQRPIALAEHCFGCTAGAGSSCGGALV